MANLETAVKFMESVAEDNSHGYDQTKRNGGIDYDCSSLVGTAFNKAGFNVSKASTTRNLRTQLLACGFTEIGTGEVRKRGDIFLKEGHHVVMCTDSSHIVHARINEKGTVTGGKPGDQTGKEICVSDFYTYKGGWDYHFRYPTATVNKVQVASASSSSVPSYAVGNNYTTQVKLKVRTGAGTNYAQKTHTQLTVDGQKHDTSKSGCMDANTIVTCKACKTVDNDIWIQTPSGWLAAYYSGNVYIK